MERIDKVMRETMLSMSLQQQADFLETHYDAHKGLAEEIIALIQRNTRPTEAALMARVAELEGALDKVRKKIASYIYNVPEEQEAPRGINRAMEYVMETSNAVLNKNECTTNGNKS